MSCRTGLLRGGRSLRDAYTGLGRISSIGLRDARHDHPADHREAHAKRYTHHEVVAPRAAGPSGRTYLFNARKKKSHTNSPNSPSPPE